MLNILDCEQPLRQGLTRRDFLTVGALTVGGLTLADVMRLRAAQTLSGGSAKSIIMVYLPGGPSHIDMYDMKPDAPDDFRGEFKAIRTKAPGLDICEHLPLQAQIADKFSVIRGIKFKGKHDPYELLSGYPSARSGEVRGNEKWPVFGAVASRVRGQGTGELPPYVNLNDLRITPESDDPEVPRYLGPAHGPFRPTGPGLANLRPIEVSSTRRLKQRTNLLGQFDQVLREVDASQAMHAMDQFQRRAIEMVTSGAVYKALDLSQEPLKVRDRYQGCTNILRALRLAAAGVSVVTVALGGVEKDPAQPIFGTWDTHKQNFRFMRELLPGYDRAVHTLLTDLYDRGLDQRVGVLIWGEFGRTPRIGTEARTLGDKYAGGRDHWWDAGFAVVAGGGMRMGQVIGETDGRAERNKGRPYTPQNILASVYHLLGINPATTFPDYQGRPVHLLDDHEKVKELF